MPELPEVQTTVTGLSKTIVGLKITDVWSDYNSSYFKGSDTIKDPKYFTYFKNKIIGQKITSVSRRSKNILIHLETDETILIHMKMTGHIIIGRYFFNSQNGSWSPAPDERKALHDPFNRFIRFVITLSNNQQLVLSDVRKFAKVTLIENHLLNKGGQQDSKHLKDLGPEPLEPGFSFKLFKERLGLKPNGRIKNVLMDPSIIAGIGNIYSDEALYRASINPEKRVSEIGDPSLKKLYTASLAVLRKGIDFGGDSMSDYRNIHGERGKFQEQHQAYRKTGLPCSLIINGKRCRGVIQRKIVGGRSAHFCSTHQKL